MLIRKTLLLLVLYGCAGDSSKSTDAQSAQCESARTLGVLPLELNEASGIAISRRNPGILWVHNDDGRPIIFAIDSTGALRGRVRVPDAANFDWEDIAVGACAAGTCLYIADIGDNAQNRTDRVVYRVPEPLVSDTVASVPTRFPFHLPARSEDAEALFVLPSERLYIISKGRSGPVTLFEFPPGSAGVDVQLEPIGSLTEGLVQLPDMVTGAGATPSGRFVAIRTYSSLHIFEFENSKLTALSTDPFDLQPLKEPQGEGIDIRDDGTVYLVSEKGFGEGSPPVSRVQCALPPR